MSVRWLLALAASAPLLTAGSVNVDLFEKVPPGSEFELANQKPVERYTENAFGFTRVPLSARFQPASVSSVCAPAAPRPSWWTAS
jgi:hypothetical protein